MAEINPAESIVGLMDQKFAFEVERISSGNVKIDLRCTGILGDHKDVLSDIFSSDPSIDIVRCSISDLADNGCSKSRLLTIPYTFSSREHYWEFVESDLAEEVLLEPESLGYPVRGLFLGEEGFRHFFSVKQIKDVGDFKNKKVRVAGDPVMRGLVSELLATPDSTSFSEVHTALRIGKIDIAEQPIVNYKSNYFYEVAPYLILDGHTLGIAMTVVTDKAWKSLSEAQRQFLIQAGKIASNYCREISRKQEEDVLAELAGLGVYITKVDDISVWQNAIKNTIEKNASIDPDFYDKILELDKK